MNDMELDELLNTWKAPPVRESWRDSVQNHIVRGQRRPLRQRRPRWSVLAGTTSIAAVLLLLVNTSALSLKRSQVPYTVDSEIRQYPPENMSPVPPGPNLRQTLFPPVLYLLVTSYNEAGSEMILSASFPNQPLKSWIAQLWLGLFDIAENLKQRFSLPPDEEVEDFAVVYPASPRSDMAMVVGNREMLVNSACQTLAGDARVIGRETILNYAVTVIQQTHRNGMEMVTLWMAPELSCFALRATIHTKQLDGSWKLITERQAVKVTVNADL